MYKVHEKSRPPRPTTRIHQTQEVNGSKDKIDETREDVADHLLKADIEEEYAVETRVQIDMQEEEEEAGSVQQQVYKTETSSRKNFALKTLAYFPTLRSTVPSRERYGQNGKAATCSKEDNLASFSDIQEIQNICSLYKLDFDHRITYLPDGTIQMDRASCQFQVLRTKFQLKVARRDKWILVNAGWWKTPTRPQTIIQSPACEETCGKLDMLELAASRKADREIILGGADYGLVTMATTIRLTKAEYECKIQQYNRYSLFGDMHSNDLMEVGVFSGAVMEVERLSSSPKQEALSEPQFTIKRFRVTAEETYQKILYQKYANKLSRRKARAPQNT
ncbi:hypothetical protein DFQ30_001867 [Apophysomyces sp. BC1015]|nr:hypothetical protein DFQ29_010006 [Apophysomyces sp. BC1021]KAG0170884.1 hypothetical protein DFQ30_001867 [Apophysomyces sp. BC1015]